MSLPAGGSAAQLRPLGAQVSQSDALLAACAPSQSTEKLQKAFSSPEGAKKLVSLKAFKKFDNTADALAAAAALVDSKLPKSLKKFLSKHAAEDTVALADAKMGGIVKEKLNIPCIFSTAVQELMRGVRGQLGELVAGLGQAGLAPMSLGLSHSLSRYKLKFSPDKVDTMVVQAIGLLDDLDKELNTYAMRVREWYGWHFPELTKVLNDNLSYARAIKLMGIRTNAANIDFSEVLDEQQEAELKTAAQVSMGTEIGDADMLHISALADQVIGLAEYRAQLYDYLKARMNAIAPNLTVLVGELVGARLIAHAGSLLSLAKHPASTVQILGAEKALFRALKTKHDTPKYGLIYHASLVGASAPKFKGKISRVLAAKCALSIRVDALGEGEGATIGLEDREKVRIAGCARARCPHKQSRAASTLHLWFCVGGYSRESSPPPERRIRTGLYRDAERRLRRGAHIAHSATASHPSPPPSSQVEARLRQLEGRAVNKAASLAKASAAGAKGTPKAYDSQRAGSAPQLLSTPKGYNADADVVAPAKKAKKEKKDKGDAEDKPKKSKRAEAEEEEEEKPKKKKKKVAAAEASD